MAVLEKLFGDSTWPDAVRYAEGVSLVRRGESVGDAARRIRTAPRYLEPLLKPNGLWQIFGLEPEELTQKAVSQARGALGQMLLGRVAENVFVDLYRMAIQTEELELVNLASEGTDTDYRVLDGRGRPVFRINIKFFGSQFRRAAEMVGLAPEDCFALATYKIRGAVDKQDEEHLPFCFAIVGVPGLTGDAVGGLFPNDLLTVATLVHASPRLTAKRKFEDAIIDYAVRIPLALYETTYQQVRQAQWYILSARRAEDLLKAKLWDRVFALRVRNFTRTFPSAEVDMHFSLREDLTPLEQFLDALQRGGPPMASTLLERGRL